MKSSSAITRFRRAVWREYRSNGRFTLPWRRTRDPYRILVSEVMLQQTQVDRVIPKYKEFLKVFPNVQALAKSRLADVLKVWNGLGYNRRAKYLRDAAIEIVENYNGEVPTLYSELVELPGVGDYTARAIRAFAFNEPEVLLETNIRTVFIQHFYKGQTFVEDKHIFAVASEVARWQNPREWHWALMDYGAHLKRSGVRNNHKSAHYAKQSKFEGSLRQVRGAILRAMQNCSQTEDAIYSLIRANKRTVSKALASLLRDGLVASQKGKWRIA